MTKEYSSSVQDFLQRVKSQIRSKEAKQLVEVELQDHIIQRKQGYLREGYSEEEAEKLAIEQMGNPTALGKEMHKIHRPKVDWFLIGLFAMLLVIGTVPFYFITFEWSEYFFIRRIIFSFMAIAIAIGIMFLDYRKITRLWPWLFGAALSLSLYINFFGYLINGRGYLLIGPFWIDFWMISILFILSFIGMLSSFRRGGLKLWIATFVMFWLPLFFFITNPNLSLAVFYFITLLLVLGFSQVPKKELKRLFFIKGGITIIGISPLLYRGLMPHQNGRLIGFLNPESDPSGHGYLPLQLQKLLREAIWWGGQGQPIQFPEMHSINVFALLVAHFGWIFGLLLLACIGLFLFRMFQTVFQTKDRTGVMIVITGVTMIGLAAVWNVAMLLGFMPLMEIPLPFVSYGGQFQVIYSVLIGLILSVYRRKDLVQVQSV